MVEAKYAFSLGFLATNIQTEGFSIHQSWLELISLGVCQNYRVK